MKITVVVTPAHAGVHLRQALDSRLRGNDPVAWFCGEEMKPTVVTPAHAGVHLRQALDSRLRGNDPEPKARIATRNGARYLFDCWPQVAVRIKSAGHVALFLDFDGTLTQLRGRAEDVPPLDLLTLGLLRRLARHPRVDLYVISGRRLADLRLLVQVPGARLFGLHGWEGRGVPPMLKERKLVQRAKQLLAEGLPKMSRIWLEDKNLGLAVHFRGAPPDEVRAARRIVRGVLEHFKPQLRLFEGKKVWEMLPGAVGGKGPAVRRLLGKPRPPTLSIFVGDDWSDESAFAALPRGITVHVGSARRTQARFYLRDPSEVLIFLQKMEAEIT
jgi:trehalose 6-phosphate phosphatase